jgi:hypothetical protein
MTKWFIAFAAAAAITSFAPAAPSMAQGIGVDVPGVGVRIGEPRREDRYRERRYREREVSYGRGCRTVTIERDDGSVRRIRRCRGD